MYIKEALLAVVAVLVCYGGNWLFGQCMTDRPIVVGLVTGILMGDMTTGILIGAALEAIFMGAVNIGGAVSAEPCSATVLAVVFSSIMGIDQEATIALAIPVAVVVAFIKIFIWSIGLNVFAPIIDRLAAKGDGKGITAVHYGMWPAEWGAIAILVFLAIVLGADPVSSLVNMIPDVVLRGMRACSALLPAVGMALLMKMLWSKQLSVFFFAGFICMAYLKLPSVAIAVIGIIIAVVLAAIDKQLFDLRKNKTAVAAQGAPASEEEEFFS